MKYKRWKKRKTKDQIDAKIKFVPLGENEQTYYFSRTNRKSSYKDLNIDMHKK